MAGSSYAWICQGQSPFMPRKTITHVVNLPTYSELILHYLSCYLPSSPTGLLLALQNNCISPNLSSFALFLHWRIFPSPYLSFSPLICSAVSAQISPPQRDRLLTPRQGWQTSCYTCLYVSSIAFITDLMIRTCQPQQITSSFCDLVHHYTFGI